GIIHADLSEYNIIVSHRGPVIFDWPQWVSRNHPSAHYYLRRDLENLLKFFKRKYDISYNLEEFLQKLN
ncbi:MAG: RIO1 family regulatory kinase/ATPase, partial [Candidatus Bathyarchaeia archaeon]